MVSRWWHASAAATAAATLAPRRWHAAAAAAAATLASRRWHTAAAAAAATLVSRRWHAAAAAAAAALVSRWWYAAAAAATSAMVLRRSVSSSASRSSHAFPPAWQARQQQPSRIPTIGGDGEARSSPLSETSFDGDGGAVQEAPTASGTVTSATPLRGAVGARESSAVAEAPPSSAGAAQAA